MASYVAQNQNLPGVNTSSNGLPGANGGGNQDPNLLGTGGTGGFLGSLFGQVPGVANPIVSASQAVGGNRGNLTNIANLTYGADTIGAAGAKIPFENNLPGYDNLVSTASGNTQSELNGQLPQDVINQITQQAAERGVATGQGVNSDNTNAEMLRSLGLTSLNLQQTGQSDLSRLIGETPTGPQYNPANDFVSPDQEQAALQGVQNAMAAPNPSISGLMAAIAPNVSC